MSVITLDLEASTLAWQKAKIHLNGYRIDRKGPVIYVDPNVVDPVLNSFLREPGNTLSGSNIKWDGLVLSANGYDVSCALEDIRVLAYINWPTLESHGLKQLCNAKLGTSPTELSDLLFDPTKRDRQYLDVNDYFEIDDSLVRKDLLKTYHEQDVLNVDRIRALLYPTQWFTEVEMPLTRMLFEMELYGCPLDGEVLAALARDMERNHTELFGQLVSASKEETFNPGSSPQVQAVLEKLGYKLEDICDKTPKGAYKVDASLLKSLAWKGDEFAKTLLSYRRYGKLLSTYIGPFIEGCKKDGRLHGSINQAGSEDLYGDGARGTNTGRLSSSSPNLQNIPSRTKEGKEIRKAFVATEGSYMFDSDLAQIEPRLVAHFTQAPKLIHAYASGLDTHGLFACDIFGRKAIGDLVGPERFIGKSSWLATVYGCSYKKLLYICEGYSDNPLDIDTSNYKNAFDYLSLKEKEKIRKDVGADYLKVYEQWMFFKDVQKRFEATNPEIFAWRTDHINRTRRLGYVVTLGGRTIRIEGLDSKDWGIRFSAERQAVNFLVQGSAADIMKLIMVRFHREFIRAGYGRVFSTVHDELLGDMIDPKYIENVRNIMETTVKLRNVEIKSDTKLILNWGSK